MNCPSPPRSVCQELWAGDGGDDDNDDDNYEDSLEYYCCCSEVTVPSSCKVKWLESDRRETQVASGQFSLLRDDDEDYEDDDDDIHDNHDNDIDDMDDDFDDEGKYNAVTPGCHIPCSKAQKIPLQWKGARLCWAGGQVGLGKELNAREKVKRWEKELNTAKGGGSEQASRQQWSSGAGGQTVNCTKGFRRHAKRLKCTKLRNM